MMFLEVKEFALILYVESRDADQSWRVKEGGPPVVDFFETGPQVLELKVLGPEPKLKSRFENFGSGSWSRKDLFENCEAGGT